MGKQTSKILKAKAQQLFELYPEKFSEDFEANKKIVGELKFFDYSKTDRNIVAGFIARLKKARKVEAEKE